jgi:hypothetical protein
LHNVRELQKTKDELEVWQKGALCREKRRLAGVFLLHEFGRALLPGNCK